MNLTVVSCSVYLHEIPTSTHRVHCRNHRFPTPQLAPAPSRQNTHARTYRRTNNPPSHDLRLPATSSRLTATGATAKSPSDAAATAIVVGATTVAAISELRRLWRPHLPPESQQVVKLDHLILAVRDTTCDELRLLQDCDNYLVPGDADPLPIYVSFLSWGTLRVTCIHP